MEDKYSQFPDELKELKQWCFYKMIDKGGDKKTKRPFNAYTGGNAKSNDETTWSDYDTAFEAISNFGADGLGFFFKAPYFGIDIDGVEKEVKEYRSGTESEDNIVAEFIETMCSYAEVSPSGKGIHIIAKGELPENGSRKGNVEMYSSGRFFTVTGDHIGDYKHIEDDEMGKVNYLHEKYIAKSEVKKDKVLNESYGNGLSAEEVIKIATGSKTGVRFNLYLNGGWEQLYSDKGIDYSSVDLAFCNDLAFWTNRDYNVMDEIFRKSDLMRDKWDENRGENTYGEITLSRAITDCTNVFTPSRNDDDFNLYVMDDSTQKIERKMYSYDDTGNAQRFINLWGSKMRYSHTRNNWFFYNERYWELDNSGEARKLVDETLNEMKKEPVFTSEDVDLETAMKALQKHLKYSRGSNGKTNMLKESQHLKPIKMEDFDNDKNLVNVANGYINLDEGKLYEHDPEKYFSKFSNVEFTNNIDCPQWLDFLGQIFNYDQELIDYLQRAIGYSLSGSTEEQMMFILHGNGRNGKSVFLDVIKDIFGNYTTNIQPQTIMVKQQSGGANADIARLQGARLVTTTEPNDGMRFDEGLVKQVTGGDEVTARFLYGDEFDFKPEFKLWMATNHKPIIRGTDDGIWRRMAIVPFEVQIPEGLVDKHLSTKLRREITAILNWAVEGYRWWKEIGLNEPETIKKQRGDYRKEMSPIEEFIEDCCVISDEKTIRASIIYSEYKQWSQDNGQYTMSSTKFGKEFSNKFSKFKDGYMFYEGVSVIKANELTMSY